MAVQGGLPGSGYPASLVGTGLFQPWILCRQVSMTHEFISEKLCVLNNMGVSRAEAGGHLGLMSVLPKEPGPRTCWFTRPTPRKGFARFLVQRRPDARALASARSASARRGDRHRPPGEARGRGLTRMLLRLTSSSFGSLLFIRSSVSSTSVEFGSSSGTGLYCVGLITPRVTHEREVAHGNVGTTFPQHKHPLEGSGGTGQGQGDRDRGKACGPCSDCLTSCKN